MNDTQLQTSPNMLDLGTQAGAQKAGEFFVDRALNGLVDGVKKKYSEAQVFLGAAFSRYLQNATTRYNQVRTLATGTTPRTIIGKNNIYVSIGVKFGEKRIDADTIDSMLRISNNILILGTGGIGKSMMMRYLFLNTANRGEYVPVLLELRKVSNQSIGQISVLDLIYSCMEDFDVKLPKEQFEYSLRLGKYLFLMDGFDEVKETQATETAAAIQAFCAKYPKNPCIITSRPRRDTSPLETFTTLKSLPLSKEQAIFLASKIWKEDEKTKEFCRQLEDELYEKHRDFAENPLLLSMMFLTFMRNNSIPNHLAEFYNKAYDALYSAHDSNDKGCYRREFRCQNLDEPSFKLLLSHFCFQSYFKEDYEFKRDDLLAYLQKSIKKLGFDSVCAIDYLEDLRNVVCIIIKDGDIYRFSHRSFQAYFAACYTSNSLTDEQQKKLFASILSGKEVFWDKEDYYKILAQICPQRFAVNALEEKLRFIREEVNTQLNPDKYFFKLQFNAISIKNVDDPTSRMGLIIGVGECERLYYDYNVIGLFRRFVRNNYSKGMEPEREYIWSCVRRIQEQDINCRQNRCEVSFKVIDSTDVLSDDEREQFYSTLVQLNETKETREAIDEWLLEIEQGRELLATGNFIDDL
ncbi:MAG: NACHT domain-containing protein [Oscillospiraceae bacterium]|nr:NACHT domain-containing protein [Oscillospiraceae bacterium]